MRHHWLYALAFFTATPLDFATPLAPWGDMRVKHAWSSILANWDTLGCPSAGTTIDLYIALNPHREDALIDVLYQVSDPKHPRHVHLTTAPLAPSFTYGEHLSKEQVADLVRPHPDTLELVTSWLAHHGVRPSSISMTHGGGRSVGAVVAPAEAEAASGNLVTVLSSRASEVTPSDLRWLYKTFAYVPTAADRNSLGVFGYVEEYPSETELAMFMTYFRSDVQPPSLATFTVEQVNGGMYDPDNPGREANLDVQYASAMTFPTPITFYSIGGFERSSADGEPLPGDMYLESLKYLLEKADIPQTISISYSAYEREVPREYTRALCTLFAQLGARGVSVLFSTGDDGIGQNCEDESGNVRFVPEFQRHFYTSPITSSSPEFRGFSGPYLTAIGGTTNYDPEVAAPLSGGGFSDHFSRPVYQDVAVSAFLERQGTQYAGLYNSEGRGIPDIAAQALGFVVFLRNVGIIVEGTSCSTPVYLSMLHLLCVVHSQLTVNALPRQWQAPALGFLNIRLYGNGFAGLNDITSGSNPGCGTDGFSAVPGWDPVTGLGTPDFEKLQNIFMIPLGGGTGLGNQRKNGGPGEQQQ
ncbi:peptidase S8/S53 domain-containing protein [Lactarius vividus]|nr:peptidase S8/S53 domain-containing protein [Lactarius vividus]